MSKVNTFLTSKLIKDDNGSVPMDILYDKGERSGLSKRDINDVLAENNMDVRTESDGDYLYGFSFPNARISPKRKFKKRAEEVAPTVSVAEYNELERDNEELTARVTAINDDLMSKEDRLKEYLEIVKELKKDLAVANKIAKSSESSIKRRIKSAVEDAEDAAVEEYEELYKEYDKAYDDKESYKKENTTLSNKIRDMRSSHKTELAEYKREIANLNKEIDSLAFLSDTKRKSPRKRSSSRR